MKANPLVGVALAFAAGIVLARFATEFLLGLPLLAAGLLIGSLFLRALRPSAIWGIVLTCGALNYCVRWIEVPPGDLRALGLAQEQLVTIRGMVLERPIVREFQSGGRTNRTSTARVQVAAIGRPEWETTRGVILASTRGDLPETVQAGREVTVEGVLRVPPGARAEGLFDYGRYLAHEGIFYQLRVESAEDWQAVGAAPCPRWRDAFADWSRRTLSRGLPNDQNLALLLAMTLGWAGALEGEVADPFLRTGTMHIFAISGLHVACIALALASLTHAFGVPRTWTALGVLPLIWFYTVATGWQSSGVRAAIMASIVLLAYPLRRPYALLNATAAASAILIFEPEQVFHASFQLSFIVVASMAWLLPSWKRLRQKLFAPDPFLPRELHGGWARAWRWTARRGADGFAVSLAATLGALPLTLWYFNIVTPVGLVANLIAVPLSSVSLTAGLASLLISLLLPPLAPICNWVAWAFMAATVAVVRRLAEFRWGYFYAEAPELMVIGLYYVWLTAVGLLLVRRTPGRWWAMASATVALLAAWGFPATRPQAQAVTALPGDGGVVWVDTPGAAHDVLLGCSNEATGRFLVTRFLRAQGRDTVPNIVLSHGDVDQAGGFGAIWEEFQPRKVFTGPGRGRSPTYQAALATLQANPARWRSVGRGEDIAGWQVLHPRRDSRYPRADDNALVLRGDIEGWRVILLSELGMLGQRELAEWPEDLKADVVIAGYPEQDEPLLPALLERIDPPLIVLSEKSAPGFGVPERRVVERLGGANRAIVMVSRERAVTLRFRDETCELSTMAGLARTFRKPTLR